MPRYKLLSLVLILAGIFFVGCGKHRAEQLKDRAEAYNRGLRWSSLAASGTLIAEDVRLTMVNELSKELGNTRIVDFAIVDFGLDEKMKKGSVIVEYSFYRVSDQSMKYRQELQVWNYDEIKNNWFLHERRTLAEN